MTRRTTEQIVAQAGGRAKGIYQDARARGVGVKPALGLAYFYLTGVADGFVEAGRPADGPLVKQLRAEARELWGDYL
jgi:hypothetical protein